MAEGQASKKRPRFLRKRSWLCGLLVVPFVCALTGAVVLFFIYRRPTVTVPVYYFIVRPAFVWFAVLGPFLLVGILALRFRWFLCGALVFLVALGATQEFRQSLRLFPGRGRRAFQASHERFFGAGESGGDAGGEANVPLRIVTWNVLSGVLGPREIVAQLAGLRPDIVFMQEFGSKTRRMVKSIRGAYIHSREHGPEAEVTIAEALGQSDYFRDFHLGTGRDLALVSRFPVTALKAAVPRGMRALAWQVQVSPSVRVTCLNVHLTPLRLVSQVLRGWTREDIREDVTHTRQELANLGDTLGLLAAEGAVILAGDFNLPPHYPDLLRATADYQDCFAANGFGWGKTGPADFPAVRIDMIFVPEAAKVHYAAAVRTTYSDHNMTLAEVVVPVAHQAPDAGGEEPVAPRQ